jgi:hypothetical protein
VTTRKPGLLATGPRATAVYTALALVMTWPLARHLGSLIAWDLGDPVFNCWVLMWTGGQVLRFLGGDFNAIHEYWNGNIFYPARLTIAYSEHLTPQMLQALPIWAATGNIVLCYNLLYLSTIVLSGLGVYLLVRDLTGRPSAAFVAGLAFAFAPYRISQGPHLQVLSSYWMPLALFGFRRYFVTRRTRALAGASAALVAQNLSCGYYMLFFAPFAGAYCLYEMAHRRLLGSLRVWGSLAAAALIVALVTWPFVTPYLQLRTRGDVGVRSYAESVDFSADTYAYATAAGSSWLWGVNGLRLLAYPKGEGEGFPGFAILALAAVGAVWGFARARPPAWLASARRWQKATLLILAGLLAADVAAILHLFAHGALPLLVKGRPYHDVDPLLVGAVVLAALLVALVPGVRRLLRGAPESAFGFYAAAALAAALLALGPRILSAGRIIGMGPYYWLYRFVPGFDGLRVPGRYLMLVALFLAVLAGLGAAALLARWRRAGAVALVAASAVLLVEGWQGPLPTNVRIAAKGYELTARQLDMGDRVNPLYRIVRDTPGHVVLIEFPFGEPAYGILATFYAGYHRRPLVNGYSGFFPENYQRRATFLGHIPFDLDAATKALATSGATLALVHEDAFPDGRGHEITDWLVARGATIVATAGADKLLRLEGLVRRFEARTPH